MTLWYLSCRVQWEAGGQTGLENRYKKQIIQVKREQKTRKGVTKDTE